MKRTGCAILLIAFSTLPWTAGAAETHTPASAADLAWIAGA